MLREKNVTPFPQHVRPSWRTSGDFEGWAQRWSQPSFGDLWRPLETSGDLWRPAPQKLWNPEPGARACALAPYQEVSGGFGAGRPKAARFLAAFEPAGQKPPDFRRLLSRPAKSCQISIIFSRLLHTIHAGNVSFSFFFSFLFIYYHFTLFLWFDSSDIRRPAAHRPCWPPAGGAASGGASGSDSRRGAKNH